MDDSHVIYTPKALTPFLAISIGTNLFVLLLDETPQYCTTLKAMDADIVRHYDREKRTFPFLASPPIRRSYVLRLVLHSPSLETQYHHPTKVNMYERKIVLVDADGHTREFYANKGIRLGEPILLVPDPEPVYDSSIFPPSLNSFTKGEDDDDLVSQSTSLIPSPPRRIRREDVMFRYTAEMK